jgi:hypothetical protein
MADNHNQREYRSNEYTRASGKAPANDPLAELARLIGQNDPFAEFGRKAPEAPAAAPPPQQQEWAPQPHAAPAYEQDAANAGFYDDGAQGYGSEQYYQDDGYNDGQADYDDVPPRRRLGVIAIAGVLAVAVVGTAAAFGYQALFGTSGSSPPPVIKADATPAKMVPPSKSEPQSSKLIYDRVGERSAGEKLVPREEQPLDIGEPAQASLLPANPAGSNQLAAATPGNMSMPSVDQPKKVRTIVIRPDQPQTVAEPPPSAPEPSQTAAVPAPTPAPAPPPPAPPQRLASAPPAASANAAADEPAPVTHQPARQAAHQAAPARNAPLSLSPNAQAQTQAPAQPEPVRTASAPATHSPPPAATTGSGHYAVQISSQRSEAEAQAAFRALQAKFPSQLNGRQPIIRRADLGSKGIYYRAMVGPFASSSEASELCQNLKSAGGSCLIQKI